MSTVCHCEHFLHGPWVFLLVNQGLIQDFAMGDKAKIEGTFAAGAAGAVGGGRGVFVPKVTWPTPWISPCS